MIAEHNLSHLPFRAWCPQCVAGKGQGFPRLRCPGRRDEQRVPTISFDYGFATERLNEEGSWKEYTEWAGEDIEGDVEKMTVLVVKDERSRFLFAHVVEKKAGVDEDDRSTRMMMKDLEELGYQQLSVKCDQEPSTMALLRRISRTVIMNSIDQVRRALCDWRFTDQWQHRY